MTIHTGSLTVTYLFGFAQYYTYEFIPFYDPCRHQHIRVKMSEEDTPKTPLTGGMEAASYDATAEKAVVTVEPTTTTTTAATGGEGQQEKVVFGATPVWITDEKGNRVETQLHYRVGLFTWVVVLALFAFLSGFYLCCLAVIPLCLKSCKDIEHINPNDGTVVAKVDRGRLYGLRT